MLSLHKYRLQQHILGVEGVLSRVFAEFKILAEHNGAGRTSLLAIPAEDTAQHIDFILDGVSFSRRYAVIIRVLLRLHVDASGRASAGAKAAPDAFFQSVIIAREHVSPSRSGELLSSLLGILKRVDIFLTRRQHFDIVL